MQRIPVDSSSIYSIGYSDDRQELEVEFQDESLYIYFNVSHHTYDTLINAKSIGSTFHSLIRKGNFTYKQL